MNVKPLHDRILVKCFPRPQKIGLIYVPEICADAKQQYGVVLAVGPGKRNEKGKLQPLTIEAGDQIMFNNWKDVELESGQQVIIQEADILGVVTQIGVAEGASA